MSHHCETGASHPYAHRLTMKATPSYIDSLAPQRSLTVTNLHITPRTTFEMERPHTQGSPRIVVINTSFKTAFLERRHPRKHVPTFPKLATDPPSMRNNRRTAMSSNVFCVRSSRQDRGYTSRPDTRGSQPKTTLTQRQTNTFASYAKYNDIVTSAKTREKEKAAESPITSNINDLSALVPEKMLRSTDILLSNEKQEWISDWITSTSAALNLSSLLQNDDKMTTPLSVIQEH